MYVVDSGANTKLYRVDEDGNVVAQTISDQGAGILNGRFRGVEWEPTTNTLFVAIDRGAPANSDVVVRLFSTGQDSWSAQSVITGFELYLLSESAADFAYQPIDLSLDGRVLAVAATDGIHVFARCSSTTPELDCDQDGHLDLCDVVTDGPANNGTTRDCNINGRPDSCDVTNPQLDCDADGVPDECGNCGKLDLVFVMDTSLSMDDEMAVICQRVGEIEGALRYRGIDVSVARYEIATGGNVTCPDLDGAIADDFGRDLPGNPPGSLGTQLGQCPGGNEVIQEDWGRATAIVAARYPWRSGATRVVVPISDEGPWCGDPVSNPGKDQAAALYAADVAVDYDVYVSPIIGTGLNSPNAPNPAVLALAQIMSDATDGITVASSSSDRLVDDILAAADAPCRDLDDCDHDGIDDTCQLDDNDCNHNGIPDNCDIAEEGDCLSEVNGQLVASGQPDACDQPDCNNDGRPDTCLACELDVVFLMDTSTSMNDEAAGLCQSIEAIGEALRMARVDASIEYLAIDSLVQTGDYACLEANVKDWYGTSVPGTSDPDLTTLGSGCGAVEHVSEDWGRAIAVVAEGVAWSPGRRRVIVPIADEGAWCGFGYLPYVWNAKDEKAKDLAIEVAIDNRVELSPIIPFTAAPEARGKLEELASGTGGFSVALDATATPTSVKNAVVRALLEACRPADCDHDGTPDTCETDVVKPKTSPGGRDSCVADGVPDECQTFDDCAGSLPGPDACEIANAPALDQSPRDGIPDACQPPTSCPPCQVLVGNQCVPVDNGTGCDLDDSVCTVDQCVAGVCQAGGQLACGDGNVCTDDTCNAATGCVHTPNNADCNDADLCDAHQCIAGQCQRTSTVICAPPNACQNPGVCDPGTGACLYVNKPVGATCSDNDKCSRTDACDGQGHCIGSNVVTCSATDQCHLPGTCDPGTGNCSNPNAPNGTTCTDSDLCTSASQCIDGVCGPKTYVDCNDNNVCTFDECNPATGCVRTNVAGPCDDGNICTQTDSCQAGRCVGGNPYQCTTNDPCKNPGACIPTAATLQDACPPLTNAPDGRECNDNLACTRPDRCVSGQCVGTAVVCTAPDECSTPGSCNTVTGQCPTPTPLTGTSCTDDGNACTIDACTAGTCTHAAKVCDDGNPCTADACNPQTGACVFTPQVDKPCNDGDVCTPESHCVDCAGTTVFACAQGAVAECQGATRSCDDHNPCTDDSCDDQAPPGQSPCVNTPNTDPCSDGKFCTVDDVCAGGQCQPGAPAECGPVGTGSPDCGPGQLCSTCHGATVCVEPLNPNDPQATYSCNAPFVDGPCDDGDQCTGDGRCERGLCVGATVPDAPDCDDGNPCTIDYFDCDLGDGGACVHLDDDEGASCDTDEDECTLEECQPATPTLAGVHAAGNVGNPVALECVPVGQVVCHDDNLCTNDWCDPRTGWCEFDDGSANEGLPCSDDERCTDDDVCTAGECVGTPDPCEDDDPDDCWVPTGECDPADGLCWYTTKDAGATCDDGDACTSSQGDDVCDDDGECGGPELDCDDDDPCTTDRCEDGECVHDPGPDGLPCFDDKFCTDRAECQAGACVAVEIYDCDDYDDCTEDHCDVALDDCVNDSAAMEGESCDDYDLCTTGDTCRDGWCEGVEKSCGAETDCRYEGWCDWDTGDCVVENVEDGVPCDDGSACTANDVCSAGVCDPGAAVDCDDHDPCTVDACVAACPTSSAHGELAFDGGQLDQGWNLMTGTPRYAGGRLCANNANATLVWAGTIPSGAHQVTARGRFGAFGDGAKPALIFYFVFASPNGPVNRGVGVVGDLSLVYFEPPERAIWREAMPSWFDEDFTDYDLIVSLDNHAGGSVSVVIERDGEPVFGPFVKDLETGGPTDDSAIVGLDLQAVEVFSYGYPAGNETCIDDVVFDVAPVADCQTGCVSTPGNDGAPCDDGDLCTLASECSEGLCVGTTGRVCDDGNPCTADSCDPEVGCLFVPLADGSGCDDDDACTTTDACFAGACVGSEPVLCGATDQCHTDGTCDPRTGECSNPIAADGTSCDDGERCTTADACDAGECEGQPVVCVASDVCHVAGECQPETGVCSDPPAPSTTLCNDGDACTRIDKCDGAGACVGASPIVCAPSDQCHDAGTCDPDTGACSNPIKGNGSTCDDGDGCTTVDTCQAGTCTGASPKTCGALDACHIAGTCDPRTGECSNPNAADGTTCPDDGDPCTTSLGCVAGACVNIPIVCAASDGCHLPGVCDAQTGLCSDPPAPSTTLCNDGDACTRIDKCDGQGECVGASPIVCAASDQCHDAGTCDPDTGACSNPIKGNGSTCDDGNGCTTVDTCQAGTCTGASPKTCGALDACHTAGTCDPRTGECSNPNAPDGTTCPDDGDPCTTSLGCVAGACVNIPIVCAASDGCHLPGVCDSQTGVCSDPPAPSTTLCNDGDACTRIDKCDGAGACVGASPIACAASDQCHVAGTCDPDTGACSNPIKGNGSTCDDGNGCTTVDTCQAGTCTGASPKTCGALDACHTAGTCDPRTGECSNPNAPDGTTCPDDDDPCTTQPECVAGACVSTPVVCVATDACHVAGTCDPQTGACSDPPAPSNTACNDGDACTRIDKCDGAGACVGSTPVECPGDQCRGAGSCDPDTGECGGPPKPDGTACSDDTVCTINDVCDDGECVGAGALDCNDNDPCTIDTCHPRRGCLHTASPNGGACDDGDACTAASECRAGACVGTEAVTCADTNPCTRDTCDPKLGCQFPDEADGARCDDGDACTTVDGCEAGRCVGAVPVVCQALDPCHRAGVCDPESGQCSNPTAPDTTACDDGSVCTQGDRCAAGVCRGTALACNDGDPCTLDACDAALGCVSSEAPDETPCEDDDPCTTGTSCRAGSCVATAYRACDDGNACTTDRCEAGVGCVAEAVEDGLACGDGDACTDQDRCLAGVCQGHARTCEGRGPCFSIEGCNPSTGACEYGVLPGDVPLPIALVELGAPAGGESEAVAIADDGRVFGTTTNADGKRHLVVWSAAGVAQDLTPGATDASARGMSGGGTALGLVADSAGKAVVRWDGTLERLWSVSGALADATTIGPVGGSVAGVGIDGGRFATFFDDLRGDPVVIAAVDVEAFALNAAGQVVGRFSAGDGRLHAFLWTRDGGLDDLGTTGVESVARALNEAGVIVGERAGQAFVRTADGAMTDLGLLCDGAACGSRSEALLVDAAGNVFGVADDAAGQAHAFVWSEARGLVALPGFAPGARPIAIADGLALGEGPTGWGATHVILWSATGERTALGTFHAASSHGAALNALEQVAGALTIGARSRAFFWSRGRGLVELGTLGGAAAAANDIAPDGRVVGWAEAADGKRRAFVTEAPRTACVVCEDDQDPPEIACPIVPNALACMAGGTEVYLGSPTVFDACGEPVEVGSDAPEVFLPGTTLVTFEAVDRAGHLASCSTSVVVEDREAPLLTCPEVVSVVAAGGACDATAVIDVAATDACDGEVAVERPDAARRYPIGASAVTVAATDGAGNRATCEIVVAVDDPVPFGITCPAAIERDAPADTCGLPEAVTATVQARCRDALTLTTGADVFPIGVSTLTFSATDGSETASCTTPLTVRDVTPPAVGCGDVPAVIAAAELPAIVTAAATDACGATVTVSAVVCLDGDGNEAACDVRANGPALVVSSLPTGTYTVRWRVDAVDPSGNTAGVDCVVSAEGLGDRDGDTIVDPIDNCPDDPNVEQFDADRDGVGDACDASFDGVSASGNGGCAGALDGGLWALLAGTALLAGQRRRRS